ncbi:hypothetical protein JJ685_17870 [Ramlibacter monticola]|uniref:Copper oxidase n=2 Tax=Ramlibacter monticola TaxID=1926872 RepID=A0A936Z343_9BURK|nr:hypothetical protein [Ramlibacter monticola]
MAPDAQAAITCQRQVTANVVAFDKPLMYNRLGAGNVNGMMFALKRDVINTSTQSPLTVTGAATPGKLDLRPDKRHRPLVLRVRVGDCLTVNLQNLLTAAANPLNVPLTEPSGQKHTVFLDEQVRGRFVGFHASGMELVDSIADDGSNTGANVSSLVAPGASKSYRLYASKEGVFNVTSGGAVVGSDGNQGNSSNGLFGQLIVEPTDAKIYRGQVFEEEMRLSADVNGDGILSAAELTPDGQPRIRYEATYPAGNPWTAEGKAGLPILNMMKCATATACEIVHSEINAVIAGPNGGAFPPSTYPLESVGKRNPTVPNRLEPFRDFASVFHDETANGQAFPGFYKNDPVFRYVLEGVKDAFMINYGSGGIGSEIIANRLGVGPTSDCADCAYEEFFLTSHALNDPALTVDIPANVGLESLLPGQVPPPGTQGPKANYVIGAEDAANVHHSYINDFVKFRNTHIGKEQHVFHLHNHQWLFNPNDDNANYLDAQGIGPGAGYTYEINFGGSGNRNKSAGDAIFHCHFYPHFAQGMWYHWRNNDTFSTGTRLAASGTGYHTTVWALGNTTPAAGARAYPDGEIVAGTPIPALVPLPGKGLAPMPAQVTVVTNPLASTFNGKPLGSLAKVVDRSKNPGYPFWVAGMEDTIGHRPPTPPLDMLTKAKAQELKASGKALWSQLQPAQADGFDGGLPRHAMKGYAAGAATNTVTARLDFSKEFVKAVPVYFPEEGTDLEQVAMAFHAVREHATYKLDMNGVATQATFVTNGSGGPVVGAPFHNPCIDDTGVVLKPGVVGSFFSGDSLTGMNTHGSSIFNSDSPRIYKGTNMQFDAVLNKTGYHFPQQRIVALWQDVAPIITKTKPPEPLVFRANTFDCTVYHHSNLVPGVYEIDDYQVRTPTDIIGQHIHLPKWDLTTTDGAANGWNFEDGTMAASVIRERILAIRRFNACTGVESGDPRDGTGACPVAKDHPYWGKVAAQLGGRFPEEWRGARTTMERWFTDPVVNTEGVDRGLGIVFTHDHYGPSTHQQIGLYSTLLAEPAGSRWVMNETGQQLGYDPVSGAPARTDTNTDGSQFSDGGPTSWQAAILTPATATGGSTVKSEALTPYREFYFEFSDFQHAYEAGVYMGAGQDGLPLVGTGAGLPPVVLNAGNAQFDGNTANAFRFAINPPARQQITPVFPDLVLEVQNTANNALNNFCPSRPCPQAIDVQDPGVLVVNYRMEPVALRVFDPNKIGPDGKPGMQAAGKPGDLAFALQSRTDRVIPQLNVMPNGSTVINGTKFPPHINAAGFTGGDPFTPMMRTYQGDVVRVKIQAGGHEEEHNATIHGVKWLQSGSGHGTSPNSGWRNAQAAGISEQFTLRSPILPVDAARGPLADYAYSMDSGNDGWWSGMWGVMRSYEQLRADLFKLPGPNTGPVAFGNQQNFNGVCPKSAPVRAYDITAVLANVALDNTLGVTVAPAGPVGTMHVGAPLNPAGGTLVYNHRNTTVAGNFVTDNGVVVNLTHQGPLHDPTAIVYVRTADLVAGKLKPGVPLEPVVIRAAAGDCLQVQLNNNLPALVPDLATYSTLQGVAKRNRLGAEGSTRFDQNLIRPSSFVGIHPQLVAIDVTQDDGRLVGANPERRQLAVPGGGTFYRWYVGDLNGTPLNGQVTVTATPIEFGGFNLQPADVIKQGAKSLVGTMVVHPTGSTWVEDTLVFNHQNGVGTRATRGQATVTAGANTFRDFSLVLTKGNTHYYRDGSPVEHMNGEGVGIPEDSQEASGMLLNYGTEPLWFRFGILPQAPFGHCAVGQTGCYGDIANPELAYSNALAGVGGDPVTPVFQANRNQQTRVHITNPHGTTRGSTLALHGHVWQRDPYICPGEARNTLTGSCLMTSVGSRALGVNPQGFATGGQESWTPSSHFDVFLPSAGGGNGVIGDYLMRDQAAFGNASGVWGIMRVK